MTKETEDFNHIKKMVRLMNDLGFYDELRYEFRKQRGDSTNNDFYKSVLRHYYLSTLIGSVIMWSCSRMGDEYWRNIKIQCVNLGV